MAGKGEFAPSRLAVLRAAAITALVAVIAVIGAGAAAARVVGPDVSNNNHSNGQVINWRMV